MGKGVMKWRAYATVKSAFMSGSRLCQNTYWQTENRKVIVLGHKEEDGRFISMTVVYRQLERNVDK